MKYKLYCILRPLISFVMKILFRVEIVGSSNIPNDGGVVLAGNHKSIFDCALVMSSTKRVVRFIAKKELLDSKLGFIPVDRNKKNKSAVNEAIEVLKNNGVIGIFPEGTFNKTEYITLPFKMGAIKMASESNTKIVPFAIVGEYRILRKNIKIIFGKLYKIKDNKVIRLLKNGNN